jgi:hypothetical protein
MPVTISLGTDDRVSQLYSFPNSSSCPWTLAETVKHWFDMTLDRDGLADQGARASVSAAAGEYVLTLDGPGAVQSELQRYAIRLPQFLDNGWEALTTVVPKIKAEGKWDPSPDVPLPGKPAYQPWRFFLAHGMAMLNQKALLFFHYPPIRLLDTNQDYLDDPVPVRCEELLTANGVTASDLPLFNTVMDAAPIAADDNQGSKTGPGIDPSLGLIPIASFHAYQKEQVTLLLNTSPKNAAYTVPMVVYGQHPLQAFNTIYSRSLKTNGVDVVEIIPGKKTAVMASSHPYVFYISAQGKNDVGSGILVNRPAATAQMVKDLVVAGWLKSMADDPTRNPQDALTAAQSYWNDQARAGTIDTLVAHQGSLKYSDPATLSFEFLIPLATS